MKRLFTLALIALIATTSRSQSCAVPTATTTLNIPISSVNDFNNGYGGINRTSTLFVGDGTIPNSLNMASVTNYIFNGNIHVSASVNMNGAKKVYILAGKKVKFNQLSMNGGDTIFTSGELEISGNFNVNNSVSGKRAVIIVQAGGTVKIGNTSYAPISSYSTGGNESNKVDILYGCNIFLPVRFAYLDVKPLGNKEYQVTFSCMEAEQVTKFDIQLSTDGKVFKTVTIILPDDANPSRTYTVKVKL